MSGPVLLQAAAAHDALLRGSRLMTRLLARTLGPHGATVVTARPSGQGTPEVLSRAGTIARRVIEVGDPFENMGAMIVRHAACTVDDRVGDGVATAAIVLDGLLSSGLRLVTAGYPTHRLVREIATAHVQLIAGLRRSVLDLDETDAVAAVVARGVGEPELAHLVTDLALGVGAAGHVDVRDAHGTGCAAEFVEGWRGRGRLLAGGDPHLLRTIEITGPAAVLVCADPVTDAPGLARVIEAVSRHGSAGLLVVAPDITDAARTVIDSANRRTGATRTLAVAPDAVTDLHDVLADLAAYCATTVHDAAAGDRLENIALGAVRRVWAGADEFATVGATDARPALDRARALHAHADATQDSEASRDLRRRAAALTGRTAVLAIGGHTGADRAERRGRATATVRAAQLAADDGVIPGGGAALARVDVGAPTTGALVLRDAAALPLRHLATRAGIEPGGLVERTRSATDGARYDVAAGRWIHGTTADLVDPLAVVITAVDVAVSAATTVLRSAVLLRSAHPERSLVP